MMDHKSRIMLMDVPRVTSRSISPVSPVSSDKQMGIFQSITRRLARRSERDSTSNGDDDSGNVSTDSCSSSAAGITNSNCSSNSINLPTRSDTEGQSSFEIFSSSASDSMSNHSQGDHNKSFKLSKSAVHFRSTVSIRRALRSLSLSSRSLSCTNQPLGEDSFDENNNLHKSPKKSGNKQKKVSSKTNCQNNSNSTPKRILRQPVSYTYLKGMSGLPTQRVPRSSICCPQGYR